MAERAKARYRAMAGKEESLRESRKSLMAESAG